MKKFIVSAAVALAVVGCKQNESGNKVVIPATQDNVMRLDADHGHGEAHHEEHHAGEEDHGHADKEKSHLDADGNYVYEVGTETTIELADSTTLKVGNLSSEFKLNQQLSSESFAISQDKTQNWITLDRTYFETGSDVLANKSEAQIDRIAKILNAYPNATIKVGGYTDNSGEESFNQKLSAQRAEAVKKQLENAGVDASRLSAEGYGSAHPICPANDTDECKAQNRRVDIRLTQK